MFTGLSPLQQSRNASNLYQVEVAFNSQQQSLRWETIQPYVLVNGELYPLRQVPLVKNRWEGFVPGAAGSQPPWTISSNSTTNTTPLARHPSPPARFRPIYKLNIIDR